MQHSWPGLLLLFYSLIFTTTACGSVDSHAHHTQAGTDTAQHYDQNHSDLKLNHGEKWPTDEALRQGMKNIRSAIDKTLQTAHAGQGHTLTQQQAESLAELIDRQIRHMFAQCKLPAEADTVLHALLADMLQAVQQLKLSAAADKHSMQQSRIQALLNIQNSLDLYPIYFNDNDWQTD